MAWYTLKVEKDEAALVKACPPPPPPPEPPRPEYGVMYLGMDYSNMLYDASLRTMVGETAWVVTAYPTLEKAKVAALKMEKAFVVKFDVLGKVEPVLVPEG